MPLSLLTATLSSLGRAGPLVLEPPCAEHGLGAASREAPERTHS